MSATITTTALASETRHGATRLVCGAAAKAAAGATVATAAYGVVVRAAGVPMRAGGLGAHVAKPVTAANFATGTIICVFWGTVLAVLINRYARQPKRTFTAVAVSLTAISLAGPLTAGVTPIETKLALGVAHLIAAAIVIPTVARRLPDPPAHQPAR